MLTDLTGCDPRLTGWLCMFASFSHERRRNIALVGSSWGRGEGGDLSFSNVKTAVENRWRAVHRLSQREPIRGPN